MSEIEELRHEVERLRERLADHDKRHKAEWHPRTYEGKYAPMWATPAFQRIAEEVIEAILRDVWQGKKNHLREQMMDVARKATTYDRLDWHWDVMKRENDALTAENERLRDGAATLAVEWNRERSAEFAVAASDLTDLVKDPNPRESLAMAVTSLRADLAAERARAEKAEAEVDRLREQTSRLALTEAALLDARADLSRAAEDFTKAKADLAAERQRSEHERGLRISSETDREQSESDVAALTASVDSLQEAIRASAHQLADMSREVVAERAENERLTCQVYALTTTRDYWRDRVTSASADVAAERARRTDALDTLAMHQREQSGMSYGAPDRCRCGAETYPERGDEEVTIRRDRAFAAHQAAALAGGEASAEPNTHDRAPGLYPVLRPNAAEWQVLEWDGEDWLTQDGHTEFHGAHGTVGPRIPFGCGRDER
ncbi:coiled-coil domain-containing protein [Luteipulveratus halotolerans]|uniref:Uncharacterized protein n=1 Tax=Luteipulveratus halotolerans TaxID=1631356 RepID=A0A0L6CKD7_9MICO|nr:hypothetical protein [Luteipulveratus halotolerans]KNX38080.1 hypothetical protein VV01_14510 [Luteipulveratus halotolerans]